MMYDRQEDDEPFDALFRAKGSAGQSDRERYGREEKVQGYLRMVKEYASSPRSARERLHGFTGQTPAPDADYCRTRLGEEISPLLRWHYYLALHFAERRGGWLARAIPLILDSAERAGGSLRSASYLLLAHNLNRWHNCRMGDAVLKSALRRMRGRKGDAHAHWCAKIVAELKSSPEVRDEVRDLLLAVAGGAKPEMAPQYLEGAVSVAHDKAPARKRWAEFHENYADNAKSPALQIAYYNAAKRHLDKRGGLRRVNEKIRRAEEVRLNEYRHTYVVPARGVRGRNGAERVGHLVRDLGESIRGVEAARDLAAEIRDGRPARQPFARVSVGDDGVPGPREGAPKGERAGHAEQIARLVRILEALFSANVRECEMDGRITAGSYVEYLDAAGLHAGTARKLVGAGVGAHFAGNYVASIHILLPQVEQTLRLLLERKGVRMLGGRDRVRQDLLKGMIAEGAGVLGENLAGFLEAWLVDEGSINLRNRVCHGLYGKGQSAGGGDPLRGFGHATSLLLMLTVCLLASMAAQGEALPHGHGAGPR